MTNLVAALVISLSTNYSEIVTERTPPVPKNDYTCGLTNCALCYTPGEPIAKDVTEIVTEVSTGTIGDWKGKTEREIRRTNYLARRDWVKSEKPSVWFNFTNVVVSGSWSGYITNSYHQRPYPAR